MKKPIFIALFSLFFMNCQAPETVDLSTAEGSYNYALSLSKKSRNDEALAYLAQVKNKFPYSKYATLSELKTADIFFKRKFWEDAEGAYKVFKELHPKHPQSDYVTFQIANCVFEQMPSTIDRDLSLASKALLYFNETTKSYPNSKWAEAAEKKKIEIRKMLAQKELYIADFYLKREIYNSALKRYENILRDFQNLGLNAKALFGASVSAYKAKNIIKTKQYFKRLASLFPNSPEYTDAKNIIEE